MTEFGCCYCHARTGHEAGCAYTLPNADRAVAVRFAQPPRQLTMNRKLHWAEHARAVKAWRTAAGWHGVPHKHLPPSIVAVSLEVRGNARRDPANWAATVKPIVDGLVDSGCWPDDTPKYVTTI